MLAQAFLEARWRVATALLVIGVIFVATPADLQAGVWPPIALSLLSPWLVLGRDARRIARGVREPLRVARRLPRWILAELTPAFAVLAVGATTLGGSLGGALVLFSWSAFLVTMADLLDRGAGRAGPAWVGTLLVALVLLTVPLWAAGWFGNTAAAPWPATLAVGLHPAGALLVTTGHAAMQDPMFYTWTLSGVVEVRPLSWLAGVGLYAGLTVLSLPLVIRAARRPTRAFAAGARSLGIPPR